MNTCWFAVARGQQRGGHRRRGHVAGRGLELGAAAVAGRLCRCGRRAVARRRQPRQHAGRLLLRHAAPHHHRPRHGPDRLLLPVRRRAARSLLVPEALERRCRRLRHTLPLNRPEPLPQHRRRQLSVLLAVGTYLFNYGCGYVFFFIRMERYLSYQNERPLINQFQNSYSVYLGAERSDRAVVKIAVLDYAGVRLQIVTNRSFAVCPLEARFIALRRGATRLAVPAYRARSRANREPVRAHWARKPPTPRESAPLSCHETLIYKP